MYIVLVSFLIASLHMYMYMYMPYIYNNFILMRMLFVCFKSLLVGEGVMIVSASRLQRWSVDSSWLIY